MFNLNDVADLIVEVAKREDKKLKEVGRGIFMMQELAFTYLVGLELAQMAKRTYGENNFEWWTEKKVVPTSRNISDLYFKPSAHLNAKSLIIEFKTRGTKQGCLNDIKKLKEFHINPHGGQQFETLFRLLAPINCDAISDKIIESVSLAPKTEKSKYTPDNKFETPNYPYAGGTCCEVCLWRVKP